VSQSRSGFASRSRGLDLILAVVLATVSIAVVLGLFELALRLAGYRAIYEMYSKPSIFWIYDPLLGWSHQPGASGEYVGPRPWPVEFKARVDINSLGLRGPEIEPLPPGGRRIMILGDSMVAGFEVSFEKSFTALLEKQLSQSLGTSVQVVNAGVRGYGTDQSYLYYRERGRQLHPEFVVFFYSGNDPVDNTTLHEMRRPFGKPAFTMDPGGSLKLVGSPVPQYPMCSEYRVTSRFELERLDSALSRGVCDAEMTLFDHSALFSFATLLVPWNDFLLRRLYYVGNPHLSFDPNGARQDGSDEYSYRLTRALLLQTGHEVAQDGAGYMVIGERQQLDGLGAQRLRSAGVEVVDLEPIEGASRQEIRFRRDGHYNEVGHKRLAQFLAPLLQRRLEARSQSGTAAR